MYYVLLQVIQACVSVSHASYSSQNALFQEVLIILSNKYCSSNSSLLLLIIYPLSHPSMCVCVSCFLQLPKMHCSRPAPWHLAPLALNRNERPIHTRVYVFVGTQTHFPLWNITIISSVFPKFRLMLGKNCSAAYAISSQISLGKWPHWLVGQIQWSFGQIQ